MGGSKRVAWKGIKVAPEQYISKKFLLSGQTLENPTRLLEHNVRAYWNHWYQLAQSGHPFAFKRVAAVSSNPGKSRKEQAGRAEKVQSQEHSETDEDQHRKLGEGEDSNPGVDLDNDQGSGSDEDDGSRPDQAKHSKSDEAKNSSSEDSRVSDREDSKVSDMEYSKDSDLDEPKDFNSGGDEADSGPVTKELAPNQCHTDEEKIKFLRSLVGTDGKTFQMVVNLVAQMSVCSDFDTFLYGVHRIRFLGWWKLSSGQVSNQLLFLELAGHPCWSNPPYRPG